MLISIFRTVPKLVHFLQSATVALLIFYTVKDTPTHKSGFDC